MWWNFGQIKQNDHNDYFIVLWIKLHEKSCMWRNDFNYMKNDDNLRFLNNLILLMNI
jgi:hypothetical protein